MESSHRHREEVDFQCTEAEAGHHDRCELNISLAWFVHCDRVQTYRGQTSVGNAIGNLEEEENPNFVVRQCLPHLVPLNSIVLHTGLVGSDSLDGIGALFWLQESCGGRRVREEEGKDNGPDTGDETIDNKKPLGKSQYQYRKAVGKILPSMEQSSSQYEQRHTR